MSLTPSPLPAQQEVLDHPARFKVVACGRRWGKTELGKIAAIHTAEAGGAVWWISPNYAQSADVWRSLKATLEPLWESKSELYRLIVLPGGGTIRVRSGDAPDSLRGASLDLVVLDEAAFMLEYVWSSALRAALSDRRGRAIFLSTPKGLANWFYRMYSFGLDPLRPEWKSWRFPTASNPLIPADEIDAAARDLPNRVFRAEYEAEFLDDSGGVFRGVLAAATAPSNAPYDPTHHYVMGVDWGRVNDFTVCAVLDVNEQALVALDRYNGIGWTVQRGRIAALAEVWHPASILAEENSIGGPNIEELNREGFPVTGFTMSQSSKVGLINALTHALELGRLTLLNDPVLLNELMGYQQETRDSGGPKFSAPPGGHDDTVIALALAWRACQFSGTRLNFR